MSVWKSVCLALFKLLYNSHRRQGRAPIFGQLYTKSKHSGGKIVTNIFHAWLTFEFITEFIYFPTVVRNLSGFINLEKVLAKNLDISKLVLSALLVVRCWCLSDSLLGCCSNPVTGQSKFKRALHSKPSEKRMPIEICFLCNSQHLHGVQLGPHTKPR